MATAYTVTLTLENVRTKERRQVTLAGDDTNANALTFDSGETNTSLSPVDVRIVDYCDVAAVGSVSKVQPYINGQALPFRIARASNLSGATVRGVMLSPIYVPGGAIVKFIQLT